MPIKEKDVKRYSAIALIVLLVVLAYIIIKPIIFSIVFGLLLAYVFYPVYKYLFSFFRERTTTALAVSIIVVLAIFIPLWFVIPLAIRQVTESFGFFQTIDIARFVKQIFPSLTPQMQVDITTSIISLIGKITNAALTSLNSFFFRLAEILLQVAVIIFVFFFGIRDGDKLKAYIKELSPLKKEKGAVLAHQFKQITNAQIYGHIIIGIVQGLLTGVGLFLFGVPKALLLTFFAIIASILPVVGAWLIWIPSAVYLLNQGNMGPAIGFIIYCVVIVSTIDNVLRPYFVSRNTKSSSAIVLIGMIGGLISFGLVGLIIGPLVLEYIVLFLDAYKNNTLADMFESD